MWRFPRIKRLIITKEMTMTTYTIYNMLDVSQEILDYLKFVGYEVDYFDVKYNNRGKDCQVPIQFQCSKLYNKCVNHWITIRIEKNCNFKIISCMKPRFSGSWISANAPNVSYNNFKLVKNNWKEFKLNDPCSIIEMPIYEYIQNDKKQFSEKIINKVDKNINRWENMSKKKRESYNKVFAMKTYISDLKKIKKTLETFRKETNEKTAIK